MHRSHSVVTRSVVESVQDVKLSCGSVPSSADPGPFVLDGVTV